MFEDPAVMEFPMPVKDRAAIDAPLPTSGYPTTTSLIWMTGARSV